MRLFKNRIFALTNVSLFAIGMAIFAGGLFVPIYLQVVKGQTATISGLLVVSMSIGMTICSITAGRVIERTQKYKVFIPLGMLFLTVGLLLLSTLEISSSRFLPSVYMFVVGCGMGLSLPPASLIVQNSVTHADIGVVTGTSNFNRSLGTSIGAAVFGALYASRLRSGISENISAEQVESLADPSVLTSSPDRIHDISDPEILNGALSAYSSSITLIFLAAAPVAFLAGVIALFIKQVKLKDKDWLKESIEG